MHSKEVFFEESFFRLRFSSTRIVLLKMKNFESPRIKQGGEICD
jgi:hypothetical protein